jgi:cytochrome c-type biogenesis protein CcmH
MSSRLATGILAATLLAAAAAWGAETRPTVQSIGDEVMCMCGCVATLNHCPHHNCATREEEQAVIQKAISEGKGETAILQELTLRYGVQVLASPPAKGFNLAAWILPGLGLMVGLVLVIVVVRRWRSKPSGKAPQPAASQTLDAKLLAAVEEEMKASGLGARD